MFSYDTEKLLPMLYVEKQSKFKMIVVLQRFCLIWF